MDVTTGHVLLFARAVRQAIVLCCSVVCSSVYLMIFLMNFNLLLVLILLGFK
jgi:hypothetical protein